MNKNLITLSVIAMMVAMLSMSCAQLGLEKEKEDNTGMLLLLLAASNPAAVSAAGGGWYTPTSTTSLTKGACKINTGSFTKIAGYDSCITNSYEGSCTLLGNAYDGTKVFNTGTGSTSTSTTNNLCVTEGFTDCTSYSSYAMCYAPGQGLSLEQKQAAVEKLTNLVK
jgi:hypothetical protein